MTSGQDDPLRRARAEVRRALDADRFKPGSLAQVMRGVWTDLDVAVATVDRQRALLDRVEWAGVHSWHYEENGCPACGNEPDDGHADGCEWVAVMRPAAS